MIPKPEGHKIAEPNSEYSNMPFTPAHPALLFPLSKIRYFEWCWTALIIGSIVPDFDYFIWLSSASSISHSVSGIFTFNLPLTIIMAYIWHRIIYPVVMSRLLFFKSSLTIEYFPDFFAWFRENWKSFLISASAGIVSHLIWDSFCHANGYMVHRIPFLLEFSNIGTQAIRRCYILWYLCSITGILMMMIWMIDFKKLFTVSAWKVFFSAHTIWIKIILITLLIATLRIALGLSWNWFRHLVIILLGSFFYATILICWFEIRKTGRTISKQTKS